MYMPTKQQIKAECEEIRKSWTPEERRKRLAANLHRGRYNKGSVSSVIPVIRVADIFSGYNDYLMENGD